MCLWWCKVGDLLRALRRDADVVAAYVQALAIVSDLTLAWDGGAEALHKLGAGLRRGRRTNCAAG